MSYDVVTMEDCASNYGVFQVESSKAGLFYTVVFHGSEGPAHCECKGFEYKGDCKHVDEVWNQACMYNPQWNDGKSDPELVPFTFTYESFSPNPCPACGGPMVYVRRAV